ncbi:MAG: arylsulfatase [Balneolaceae bacterium]|nr:MAG: arylsulfatase [Balneolaceae bacterium]
MVQSRHKLNINNFNYEKLRYLFKRSIHLVVIFLAFSATSGCATADKEDATYSSNPNIIILFVDDMGYGDIGAYNEDSKIPTPHLDNLATEGIRFMDAHAPGALCHPSRYGLLTGRYPFRTNVNVWPNEPVIEEGRMTIGSILQNGGYRTAMVGKWHLGFDESQAIDKTSELEQGANFQAAYRQYDADLPLPGGPFDSGFDSFFGIRASTDIPPYFYIRDDMIVNPPTDTIDDNFSGGHWTNIQGAFWRAGGIAPDLELIDVLPRFIEESIQVIQDHYESGWEQPLMLYVALPSPHTPWLPTESFEGRSDAGMYGDFMAMVDAKLGKILQELENKGKAEETLVIFTSDNGPVWYDKDIEQFGHDSAGGLRGMKGDVYEGGHRMPFIVRWPGMVEPGSVTNQTISFTDLLATFADITGAELPEDVGEDSFSILPVLTGTQPESEAIRPPVVVTVGRGMRSIQDRTWKLIDGLGSGGFTAPAFIEPGPGDPEGQLYNLEEDLAETNNLWFDHPEEVERLLNLLDEYDNKGRSRPNDFE